MRSAIHHGLALAVVFVLCAGTVEATLPIVNPEFLESTDACITTLDRSAELVPGGFTVTFVEIGGGLADVEVSATLTNTEVGSYAYASAIADFSATSLTVAADPAPTPIGFGDIAPNGSVPSITSMTLRLPTAEVPSLVFLLADGQVPFRVEARQRLVLRPGIYVHVWTPSEDANAFPLGIPLWDGANAPPFGIEEVPAGDRLFIVVDQYKPVHLHPHYWFIEYAGADWSDSSQRWDVTWGAGFTDIDDVIVSGTFCGETGVDDPADGTPARFNGVAIGGLKLSGEVAGQLVKVTSSLGVRDGDGRWDFNVVVDASLTAQVTAEADASASGTVDLADVCIPVATIPVGLAAIPVSLSFTQWVGLEGSASAGMVAGFQKHLRGGFTLGFDTRNADPFAHAEPVWEEIPIAFTPPRLTRDTGLEVRASAGLDVGVALGPDCASSFADAEIGIRSGLYGRLGVDPDLDPWWELSAGGSLEGHFEIDLLGYAIPLFTIPIAEFPDATTRTGSKPPAMLAGAPPQSPALTSGEADRWAVAIDDLGNDFAYIDAEVALLDDGSIVAGGNGLLTRLSPAGELQWAKRIAAPFGIVNILPESPASLAVMLSQFGSTTLARLDPATGAFQSATDYRISITPGSGLVCAVDSTCIDDATPPGGMMLVGRVNPGFTDYDICAVKLDASGNVVWSKILSQPGLQYAYGVARTPEGGFAIVGFTSWGPDVFHEGNGLLIKLSPDGDLEWSKALVSTSYRADSLHDVVVRDDGRWYFTGASQGTPLDPNGLIVGWVEGDGSAADLRVYSQDETWEQDPINAALGPFVPTQGGASPYDSGYSIALSPGGVVVVGRTSTTTGNSEPSGAWALELGHTLVPEWFRTWDGGQQDILYAIETGPDGYVAAGGFDSPLPLGTGGTPGLSVMKLPFEGGVGLLPGAGMAGHYIQPHDHGWPVSSYAPDLYGGGPLLADIAIGIADSAPVVTTAFGSVLGPDPPVCVRLLTEPGHPSTADACTDDEDGDAVPAPDDLCPDEFDPDQADADGDDAGDACDVDDDNDGHADTADCAPLDPGTWALPSEVAFIGIETITLVNEIVWTPPASPGSLALTYDVLSSPTPMDFVTDAFCEESADGADTRAVPVDHAQWSIVYYLVRARNACGAGTLGTTSAGVPRVGRSCP